MCFLAFPYTDTRYYAIYPLQGHFNHVSVDPALYPLWLVFNFPQQTILSLCHNKTNRFLPFYLCMSLTLNT